MRIVFDLDGTLLQTEKTVLAAVGELFKELSLPIPDADRVLSSVGKTTEAFMRDILPEGFVTDDVRGRLRTLEWRAVRERGVLFPGVQELLSKLHAAGHMLYICSTGSGEYIDLVLKSTGIDRYFAGTYSAAKGGGKAAILKEIATQDLPCVMVGDTAADIEAAAEAGIASIAVLYGYGARAGLAPATCAADTVADIASCVCRIGVFAELAHRLHANGWRVVGISGIDTSGKTVFTDDFSKYLSAVGIKNAVLHIDDFHNPLALRRQGENEIEAYYRNAFNYDQVIGEVLRPLRENGSLDREVLCLDLDTDSYEKRVRYTVADETVLLIEGVLLFRPPISDWLDGRVFLHIGFEEMLRRARVRDVPKYGEAFMEKYQNKYIPIQKRYLSEHSPAGGSDFVIDNSDYRYPVIIGGSLC